MVAFMRRPLLCLFLSLALATVPMWAQSKKPAPTPLNSSQANKAYYDAVHQWMAALASEVERFPTSKSGDITTASDAEKSAAIGALSAQLLVCRGIEEEHRTIPAPPLFQPADQLFRSGVQTFKRSAKKLLAGDASGIDDVQRSGQQIAQASQQIEKVWKGLQQPKKGALS